MSHTFTDLLTHALFSTKGRAALLADEIAPDLFAYIGGIVGNVGGKALIVNGMRDHIHMLIRLPGDVAVADCMRIIKANSSKWVHERWPERHRFAWQTGYTAFSVSLSQRDHVYQYIRDQQEHHRKVSFREELVAFLRKYGISYADRDLED